MGNRLTKIVTKTGDDGSTALADAKRRAKDEVIFHAIGDIDELNSCIGLARNAAENQTIDAELQHVQQQLFDCNYLLFYCFS